MFWEFIKAVFSSWVEAVGIILTILPFIEKVPRIKAWLQDKPFLERYAWLLWILGGFCIVWGFYAAWKNQYDARQAAERKFEELTKPNLSLSFDEFGIGIGGGNTIPKLLITASVASNGAPSIADGWNMVVKLVDGSVKGPFQAAYIDPSQPIVSVNPAFKISSADALYNKTMQPIQRGDKKRGILVFLLSGLTLQQLEQVGTKFTMTAKDITGREFSAEHIYKSTSSEHQFYPGLEAPPQ